MILPRSGRMAWNSRSRPPSALPPAESPSTRYSSQRSMSLLMQSRSLPGRPPPPSTLLRLRSSVLGLAGRFAGFGRQDALADDDLGRLRVLFQVLGQEVAHRRVDDAFDFAVAQLGLRLAFELRVRARGRR